LVSSCRLRQRGRQRPDFICINLSVNYFGEMYSDVNIWSHYYSFLLHLRNGVLSASTCRFLLPEAEAPCALDIFVGVIAVVRHDRLIE
jgi:hypothetical protein